MKKQLLCSLIALLLLFTINSSSQCEDPALQCNYTFTLTDSWGDGWNGNTMSVMQNGVEVALLGTDFTDGVGPIEVVVPLCDATPFQLIWNDNGSFSNEVGVSITNPFDQLIFDMQPGTLSGGIIFTAIPNCNSEICISPFSVTLTEDTGGNQIVSWNANGADSWQVYITTAGAPAPDSNTSGAVTPSPQYPLSSLPVGLQYDIYVRTECDGSFSSWTLPVTYVSECLPPGNLEISDITTATAQISWNGAGSATEWEIIIQLAGATAPTSNTAGTLVSSPLFAASGLQLGTDYKVYVRAKCSEDNNSIWRVASFTTQFVTMPPLVTNNTQYSPEQLINGVLVNDPCIQISNVTSSLNQPGAENGIGYFVNNNDSFPLSSGLVLSTGNVNNIPGPNTSVLGDGTTNWQGDTQLETIISSATGLPMDSYNATRLEFDFTTSNEFMSFNFLLASDEYGTFQCDYADAFAFLLTDLMTGQTTNIAVVPGTSIPISVVTIRDNANNPGCVSVNPGFFDIYNDGPGAYTSATNFNGQTAVMTASSPIIPGNPYHIKLVIADRGDANYDSAVFIEAGSFSAGPPECTDKIQLVAFVDENANGLKDQGEDNFTYGSFVYQQNNAGDIYNITSPFGTYTIYESAPGNTYDFDYEINPEFAPYYALSSFNYDDISIVTGSGTQILYFPVSLSQGYSDVAVSVIPVTLPVPGFSYYNKVEYRNLGVAAANGTLTFTHDPLVDIANISPSGTVANMNGFSHNFTNLQPNELRSFMVEMNVPAMPAVNIDDLLTNTAEITAGTNDISLANNSSVNTQIVVGSYDPNDVTEAHGEEIPINTFTADDYLYYTIRFQNTGTSNAINIVIEDVLDAQLDPESIRMLSASHDYILERVGNQLKWRFNFIQLVPALQDEMLSQGYVMFKIKVNPGFAVGDVIPNTAEIFFDTNPGIQTNTFNTVFTQALSVNDIKSASLQLYPNPASNIVSIDLNSDDLLDSVILYDVLGKQVKKMTALDASQTSFNVSSLAKGVYVVEIETSSRKTHIRKLVVE